MFFLCHFNCFYSTYNKHFFTFKWEKLFLDYSSSSTFASLLVFLKLITNIYFNFKDDFKLDTKRGRMRRRGACRRQRASSLYLFKLLFYVNMFKRTTRVETSKRLYFNELGRGELGGRNQQQRETRYVRETQKDAFSWWCSWDDRKQFFSVKSLIISL